MNIQLKLLLFSLCVYSVYIVLYICSSSWSGDGLQSVTVTFWTIYWLFSRVVIKQFN